MDLPQIIILSTQRAGTHLLESFLKNHPKVNGRGEMFLRYERHGTVENNDPTKLNIAILMYNQMDVFKSLGGQLQDFKIIHLLRDPKDIALSRCQMIADRQQLGSEFKAHQLKNQPDQFSASSVDRPAPDMSYFEHYKNYATEQQEYYKTYLRELNHLSLSYEEFVSENKSIECLNEAVVNKLSLFLNIESSYLHEKTLYVKTNKLSSL